jgi:hypothetical protein
MARALSNLQKASITTHDAKVLTHSYVGPFPHHSRPSADECRAVKAALEELHGPVVRVRGPEPGHACQVPSALSARRMLEVDHEERKHVLDRSAIKVEQQESETGNQLKRSPPARQNGISYKKCKEEFIDDLHAVHAGTCPVPKGARAVKREPLTDVQRSKVSPLLPEGFVLEAKIEKSPGERRDLPQKVALEGLKLDRDQKCGSNAPLSDVPATPSERAADLKWVKQEFVEYDTGAEECNLRLPNLLKAYETPQRVLRSQTKKSRADHRKSEAETLEEPSAKISERRQLESGTMPLQSKKQKFEDSAAPGALVAFPTTPEPLEAGNQMSKSPLTPAPQDAAAASHMSVLDSLVRTILSQNTTDKNSKRAFASLKEMLPTWEDVRAAGQGPLAASIKCGGLAEVSVHSFYVAEILLILTCIKTLGPSTASIRAASFDYECSVRSGPQESETSAQSNDFRTGQGDVNQAGDLQG